MKRTRSTTRSQTKGNDLPPDGEDDEEKKSEDEQPLVHAY